MAKLEIFGFALAGLFALACGLQGFFITQVSTGVRILLLAAGAAMLWPDSIPAHLAGLLLLIVLRAVQKKQLPTIQTEKDTHG